MRVSIELDGAAVSPAAVNLTPAADAAAGGALDGGQPSAVLLQAVAAAGGLAPGSTRLTPMAITGDSAMAPVNAGPTPG